MKSGLRFWLSFGWLWAACGIAADVPAPTFYRDVLPILQQRCQSCHRPGEIGPMPLVTYAQVRPWAKGIREAVLTHRMPPWFADARFGRFANDLSLTAAETATLTRWAEANAPAGDPATGPAPKTWPEQGSLARVDQTISAPKAFAIPAKGQVEYQYLIVPTGFTTDRWVQAAELRPSDRRAVHHLVVYVREPGSAWLKDVPPGTYYVPPVEGGGFTTSDILAIYTPGSSAALWREGMAKKIPAGADLVFQFHYTPYGKATTDQTKLSLTFADKAPAQRVLTLQMGQDRLLIPPGEPHQAVSVQGTLPKPALLLSLFPHMHLRGAGFEYLITEPGKAPEVLLRLDRYDFHWQMTYELATPRPLPAGTRLRWTGYFDNSVNNPRNPDPGAEVRYGEQSWQEMMIGFFDVAVPASMDKNEFFRRTP